MIADVGTRKGCSNKDVSMNSDLINGLEWMSKDKANFPTTSIKNLKLDDSQIKEANKETYPQQSTFVSETKVPAEVKKHYTFLHYLIDPNVHNFTKVIRIMTYVMKFIRLVLTRRIDPSKSKISPWKKIHINSAADRGYFMTE